MQVMRTGIACTQLTMTLQVQGARMEVRRFSPPPPNVQKWLDARAPSHLDAGPDGPGIASQRTQDWPASAGRIDEGHGLRGKSQRRSGGALLANSKTLNLSKIVYNVG